MIALNDIILVVTEQGVKKLLRDLNTHKACGPDGITSRVIKELPEELAPGFTTLFQSSLASGTVPEEWRHALVTPFYKKGEHYNPANYCV